MFIENAFSLFLKPAYSSIVVWNVGDNQPPHADKEHPDGSPNGTPFYDISSLIYINDNFDGGSIYFPNQNFHRYSCQCLLFEILQRSKNAKRSKQCLCQPIHSVYCYVLFFP